MDNKDLIYLARTNYRGKEGVPFGIKSDDRRRHVYILGQTGTGKTTLIENMVLQDIIAGRGVGFLDPHGDAVLRVIDRIPPERIKDVVYFDPTDFDYPIGFNVLEVSDPQYKHLVISDLLAVFKRIWAGLWSARMEYILENSISALIDTPGTTLLGSMRILVDRDYRQKILANVKNPVVKAFWISEYDKWPENFRTEAIAAIQNKIGAFLTVPLVRNIVGQTESTIHMPEIINSGKIFLVNLSKGKIGEDNSALLGAMLVTKIYLASMERVRIPEEERRDFYLYVDEFQNFVNESFATILAEARKYRLDLTIAHQYAGQLINDLAGKKVFDAVIGNVGTKIIFRIGSADAFILEKELTPELLANDLVNLPNFQVYLRLMVDGVTSRPFSAATLPPLSMAKKTEGNFDKVVAFSRDKYGKKREEVEDKILKWSGMMEEEREKIGEEKMKRRVGPQIRREYAVNLESLGIGGGKEEFRGERREQGRFQPQFQSRPREEFSPRIKEGEFATRAPSAGKTISLDDLKPQKSPPAGKQVMPTGKQSPKLDELREVLKEIGAVPEKKEIQPAKQKGVLKPGEKISLNP
ncbi:MAG: hypothetical protein A3H02_02245 [Candidatus Niyogibacteria bacterium RIFCSPLOWO2_12_FULL_41_13]|uniref:Type IV secretion system coupling protein TraD DNA-binding domain-containing protein n=1 Tax=Candidatus Niyogibacteria bacterium RIFCSPLOWO2_12_FULL_41_13 TaxID=1801726 RepID=A0A1G2F2G8_9BACT|nr:MAG: hypothetical protein A3H02_02245 [Candidatus Niyogibacteria bacterium RIFCSPLOWO2_12_FULL_41_13]